MKVRATKDFKGRRLVGLLQYGPMRDTKFRQLQKGEATAIDDATAKKLIAAGLVVEVPVSVKSKEETE